MNSSLTRCPNCGAKLAMPSLLPLLLVPPILGLVTWFGLPLLAAEMGTGFAFALLSIPFFVFLVYLGIAGRKAASLLGQACRECGH